MEKGYWGLCARKCDSCTISPAVLYCSADAAYLCSSCDSRAHPPAATSAPHGRVWLCEVCEQAPAAVTCKADAAVLCLSCDADIHAANPLARRHDRVPVIPFLHHVPTKPSSAAAAAAAAAAPVADQLFVEDAWKGMAPDLNFFADVDPYLDLDYADGMVPVQGKPVAEPLPAMAPAPPEGVVELDFAMGKATYSSYAAANSFSHSVSSSEVGVVPDGVMSGDVSKPHSGRSSSSDMDRAARVMRYREKRKNRRFEKTIRYASRKAYAETRPRIKGRFAKRGTDTDDVDLESSFLLDNGYGVGVSVVPSY